MIFGENSLWMVKENSSDREGLKFGSISDVSPAGAEVIPLKFGWARVGEGVGRGATSPSVPMRKAFVGFTLPAPWQIPSMPAPGQVIGCKEPAPSSGTKTKSTPLRRPKMRLHPPRMTVFPLPRTLPKSPFLDEGLQAAATWGLKPP